MRRIVFRVIAILTFILGVTTVWYLKRPSPPPGQFVVHIPPAPVPLTPEQRAALPNDDSNLVVSIEKDGKSNLNKSESVGSAEDPSRLTRRLRELFEERVKNRAFAPEMRERTDLSDRERTLKIQVTVRAPRSMPYESVVRVVDAAKDGGAHPVLLQVDDLPR